MSAPPANPPPNVVAALAEENLGPMLIGLAISSALWGVVCMQTYWYWMHFKDDNIRMRHFTMCLWIIDTVDLILSYRFLYFYAIQNFGSFPLEVIKPWEFSLEYLTSSAIMFSVQLFFVSKLWHLLSHHWGHYLLLLIVALGAISFGAGLGQSIRGFQHPVSSFIPDMIDKTLPDVQQVCLVLTDVSIMVLLSTILLHKRTGMRRTDNMIVNLVLFAVSQGILTSLFQFLAFITYITMPDKLIWFAFRYSGLQIYVNAVLASLNTRHRIRDGALLRAHPDHQSLNTDLNQNRMLRFSPPRSADHNNQSQTGTYGVHVLTASEIGDERGIGHIHLPDIASSLHKVSEADSASNISGV